MKSVPTLMLPKISVGGNYIKLFFDSKNPSLLINIGANPILYVSRYQPNPHFILREHFALMKET